MDRLLFDLNPNPILIYDTGSLRIIEVNESFLRKYEYSENEITQLTIEDIRPKEKKAQLFNVLGGLKEEGINRSEVVCHQSKSGKELYVNISSHQYDYKGHDARIVLIHDVTERVIAEQKAKQAFEELNHHVNQTPLAMVKWDADFNIIGWSDRAEEITGFPERFVMGKTPDAFRFYGDDLEIVKRNMQYLINGKRDKVEFEVGMFRRDGVLINLRTHASVLRDDEGEIISVLTFVDDITEQKKAEVKYQRLFENANDGIFIMKGDRFIDCNDRVLEIYGCDKPEDIIGKTPVAFSPEIQPDGEPSREKARRKVQSALDGNPQIFEWKHTTKDGTPFDAEVSLNRLDLQDDVYLQAIVRDLTEQKQAQEKIRRSERLFRKLFLKAPGALLMVDEENKVLMVNQSFVELFGYSEEELIGQDIDKAIVKEEEYHLAPRMPGNDFKDGKFYDNVIRYTKEGEPRDILLGAIPVYLDDEPIAGFGIYIDVTEQKKNERKLKQSLEEKQVLLEEIHHRVKNNLAIISGMLQLQAFETEDERTRNALNDGQLRIQSIGIVHELLYQSENFSDISFKEYINKLVGTIKKTLPFDHQHIDIEVDTSEVSMDINQAIPSAILINELVTNSYKHGFEGLDSGTIHITLSEKEEDIVISVEDDGVGLPEDFDIQGQSSIGMNLIQTLTQQLDGKMEFCGKDGTRFEVRFEKTKRRGSSNLHLIQDREG